MWGRLLLSLFWCDCSAFFLGHLRFSTTCLAAGYPSGVPHLADSGWLTYSCSGSLAWGWGCLGTDVLLPHLVFYLVPAQLPLPLLPLQGSAPLSGVSACLTPVCLGWVCFWPAVSQAFVDCEGSLDCPSWFVTALGSWTAYSGCWMVQVPAVFLNLTLGSSLSLPVLTAGLRWLRFILGCPPSVASLWRGLTCFFIRYWLACPHGAAVPLDSWDRSPISGSSVFFLSPRP